MFPFPYPNPAPTIAPVGCRPLIYGVPTRTEFYRVQETRIPTDVPGTESPGAEIEFVRNSVITGISLVGVLDNQQDPFTTFNNAIMVDVIKDGHEHLCTDGKDPQWLAGNDVRRQFEGDYLPVWIPVDQGEKWRIRARIMADVPRETYRYAMAFRAERLLSQPQDPIELTETVLYKATFSGEELAEDLTQSVMRELDFRTDGIVTGIRASRWPEISFPTVDDGWDVLVEGTQHLSTTGKTTSPLSSQELSQGDWLRIYQAVSRHEKWQIVYSTEDNKEFSHRNFLARVEERRRQWERW